MLVYLAARRITLSILMLNDCLCQRILITVCLTFTLAAIEMNEGLTVIGRGSEASCILLLKDGENILVCECVTIFARNVIMLSNDRALTNLYLTLLF